jgi:predicted  nucleic acid-binding Zn-ribbon protein
MNNPIEVQLTDINDNVTEIQGSLKDIQDITLEHLEDIEKSVKSLEDIGDKIEENLKDIQREIGDFEKNVGGIDHIGNRLKSISLAVWSILVVVILALLHFW